MLNEIKIEQEKEILLLREKVILLKQLQIKNSLIYKKMKKMANLHIPGCKKQIITNKMWNVIVNEVNNVYPDFYGKVYELCPDISNSEWRYCCLLLFAFNTKEEAVLLNILPESVRKRRFRLSKKLGIFLNRSNLNKYFIYNLLY